MKQIITNAADITILRTIDNNTLKTGGGPISIGATAVMASKGKPFTVIKVRAATVEKLLGKPLPKKAVGAEGLRQLNDALKELLYCNVVRVVADDYRFPSLTFDMAGVDTAAAHPHNTVLSIGAGNLLQVWPIDGDPSTNRSFEITNVVTDEGAWVAGVYAINDVVTVAGGRLICVAPTLLADGAPTLAVPTAKWRVYNGEFDNRFTINFYDKDKDGTEYVLESYLVGLDPEDTSDMGTPAYIETVLEQQSERFRANYDEATDWATALVGIKAVGKVAFTGGTNGTDPESADWKAAWDIFRNETFEAKHMFAAGNYDADVLSNMLDIADKRRVAAYFDVSPALTHDQAITWIKGTGLASRNARVTYSPISANDPTYGGAMVWGASGEKVAAKCRGEAIFSGATPGVHFAAAGTNRAMITRTGIKPLHPEDVMDRDALYSARINPIITADGGGAVIDDDLSLYLKESYSRFAWVVDIDNFIAHQFLLMAAALKFEPDGLTRAGLTGGMKSIMDPLVTSGALVKPRDTADGTKEYIVTIVQIEIDLWSVTWDFCPTGSARRIAGQPRYIK